MKTKKQDRVFIPEPRAKYTFVYKLGSPYPIQVVCNWYAVNELGEKKLLETKVFSLD